LPLVQFLVRDIREKIPETFISKMKMTARDLLKNILDGIILINVVILR